MLEIKKGLKNNLDLTVYANKDYSSEQMEQIRLGLEANLDVSVYDKKEFYFSQMREIRKKLLEEGTL